MCSPLQSHVRISIHSSPCTNQHMQETDLEKFSFFINACAVFAFAQTQENYVCEEFLKCVFARLPPPSAWIQWPYSHSCGANKK